MLTHSAFGVTTSVTSDDNIMQEKGLVIIPRAGKYIPELGIFFMAVQKVFWLYRHRHVCRHAATR